MVRHRRGYNMTHKQLIMHNEANVRKLLGRRRINHQRLDYHNAITRLAEAIAKEIIDGKENSH